MLLKYVIQSHSGTSNVKGKTLTIMVKHGYEVDVEYSKQLIIDKINFFFW